MPETLIRKLRHGAELSAADEATLLAALQEVRDVPAHTDLIREGEWPHDVHAVIEGLACRYKLLPDGTRQIMAWLLPGDFCDLHVAILDQMDHAIATLAPSRIALLDRENVAELATASPNLTRALWWATLVDEAVLREWLVNMGRRPADRQIAHLFCEVMVRLQAVGRGADGTVELPVTQVELADTLGLSSVHVNRVLQQLRGEGVRLDGRTLRIADIEGLKAFAEFDASYLHLASPAAVRGAVVHTSRRQAAAAHGEPEQLP